MDYTAEAAKTRRYSAKEYRRAQQYARYAAAEYARAARFAEHATWTTRQHSSGSPAAAEANARTATRLADRYLSSSFQCTDLARSYARMARSYVRLSEMR